MRTARTCRRRRGSPGPSARPGSAASRRSRPPASPGRPSRAPSAGRPARRSPARPACAGTIGAQSGRQCSGAVSKNAAAAHCGREHIKVCSKRLSSCVYASSLQLGRGRTPIRSRYGSHEFAVQHRIRRRSRSAPPFGSDLVSPALAKQLQCAPDRLIEAVAWHRHSTACTAHPSRTAVTAEASAGSVRTMRSRSSTDSSDPRSPCADRIRLDAGSDAAR